MALTLTEPITAAADEFVVTGAVPANVGPGFRFRIDDELLRLQGFGPHTEIVGAYARQWAGKDPQRWLVERGVEHSTPASHAQGADVLAANDAYVSSDDLTPPSPFTGGEGGSGLPAGGDVGDVVTNTAPGEGEWAPWHDGLYVQPTDPGAVGAGKLWVDTTTDPPFIVRRGVGDDEWVDLLSAYVGAARATIDLTGGAGAAGDSGGTVSLTGGTGDDGATNGARIIAEAGGETDDGYLRIKTPGIGGGAAIFGATGTVPVNTDGLGRVGWGTLADISADGLPTSDPAVAGALWNDTGTLKVSAG